MTLLAAALLGAAGARAQESVRDPLQPAVLDRDEPRPTEPPVPLPAAAPPGWFVSATLGLRGDSNALETPRDPRRDVYVAPRLTVARTVALWKDAEVRLAGALTSDLYWRYGDAGLNRFVPGATLSQKIAD